MLGVLHLQNAVCEKAEAHSKATEDLLQQVASLQAQLQENDLNKTKQIRGDRGSLGHRVQWDNPYIGNSKKENAIMTSSNK